MSWFHRDSGGKVHPILKHADSTTFLGAEVADGRLARLCYTGHASELSSKGVVQAIVPGGALLWRAEFAEEHDVREGHVAVVDGVVVTRVAAHGGHTLIGHELWTGAERWRRPVARMVSRMGLDAQRKLVFVTFDHAVHAIDVATGNDELRQPVQTDGARDRVIDATRHPTADWDSSSASGSSPDWSRVYRPVNGLEVWERDWSGTREFGVGHGPHVQILGSGDYKGAQVLGDVVVLAFVLERDGVEHHHWYLYTAAPLQMLGMMRADGTSEMYANGSVVWQGKL